jgi:hypothetical protein
MLLVNLAGFFYARGLTSYFAYPVSIAAIIAIAKTPVRGWIVTSTRSVWVLLIVFTASLLAACVYHIEPALWVTAFGMVTSLLIANYLRSVLDPETLIAALEVTLAFHLVLFAISLATTPFRLFEYRGIFRNPNSLGVCAVTAVVTILALLRLKRYSTRARAGLIVALFACLLLTVMSSSRTSVGVAALALLSWALLGRPVLHARTWLIWLSIAVLVIVVVRSQFFYSAVLVKTLIYAKRGDVLNGRLDVWAPALDVRWLGHGRAAALETGIAESIFVAVLYEFGVLSVAALVALVIASLVTPLTRQLRRATLPLFPIVMCFALQGLSGSMFGYSTYFLWLLSIAYMASPIASTAAARPRYAPSVSTEPAPSM